MLMECRSTHRSTWFSGCPSATAEKITGKCNARDSTFFQTFGGFQWYDVGQQHILTNTIFRNCRADWNRCIWGAGGNCTNVAVFTSLTHSDQFVPELMQITSGLSYQNVSDLWRYSTKRTHSTGVTVSGRLQSWYDVDGTAALTGGRTMIGSVWSNDWWKYNSGCTEYIEAWRCRLAARDGAASVIMGHNSTYEASIGTNVCMNGGGAKPCPVIGTISHFGSKNESAGLQIGVNAKVTGPLIDAAGGWFIRFTQGTPKRLTFSSVQLLSLADTFLVALPYPSGTNFSIYHQGATWCNANSQVCKYYMRPVNTIQEVVNGYGDAYYWNNGAKLLYMRLVQTNYSFGSKGSTWGPTPQEEVFARGGHALTKPSYKSSIIVESNCPTNPCAPQPSVPIPAARPYPAGMFLSLFLFFLLFFFFPVILVTFVIFSS